MHEIGLEKVCIWNGSSMEAHNNVLNCKPVHSVVQSKALAFSQTVNVPYTNVMLNTTLNAQSILLHIYTLFVRVCIIIQFVRKKLPAMSDTIFLRSLPHSYSI